LPFKLVIGTIEFRLVNCNTIDFSNVFIATSTEV